MAMRDIRASVEVRALIGAEKLRELHGDAFVRYDCWQCGRKGRTTEPTSIVVLRYRTTRVVKLVHAACADSQIIEIGADRPSDLEAAGPGNIYAKSAVLQYTTAPRCPAGPSQGGKRADL